MAKKKVIVDVAEPIVETPEPAVEQVEAEVVTTGTVIANILNVRSGPSLDANPIGTLYKDTKVEYTKENDEWIKLTDGGFCMSKYIQ